MKDPKGISGIYKITNLTNGKIYIGRSNNCQRRWNEHVYEAKADFRPQYHYPLSRAIRKYGIENFKMEILKECSPEEFFDLEIEFIEKLKATDKNIGYNTTKGGEGNLGIDTKGEKNGRSILTEVEVLRCRQYLLEGRPVRKVWEEEFKDKITYNGFRRMYFGRTWSHIGKEILIQKQPISKEIVLECRDLSAQNVSTKQAWEIYKGILKISYSGFRDMYLGRTWKNVQ